MMIVRCPACQTVFRVRPEQLRSRSGRVRCGHCYTPFGALEHRIDEAAPGGAPAFTGTGTPPPPSDASNAKTSETRRFFVLEERVRDTPVYATSTRPTRPPASSGTPPAPPLAAEWPDDATNWPPPPAQTGAETTRERDREPPPPPARTTFDRIAERLDFEIPDAFLPLRGQPHAPSRASGTPQPADTPSTAVPPREAGLQTAGAHESAAAPPWQHAAAVTGTPARPASPRAIRYRHSPARDPAPAQSPANEPVPPVLAERPDRRATERPPAAAARRHRDDIDDTSSAPDDTPPVPDYAAAPAAGPRWLWGLAVGILAGALAVQAAYLFRLDITRQWPQLRPLYVELCAHFGCEMPLPRNAAAIRIANSDLESDPLDPSRFMLNARIRNEARHPQQHPHLELTLTDARDRPVVRRVLAPDEWAPSADHDAGFLPGEEIVVALPFAAPGVTTAVGYRLYAFFP
jgi:predicted Zn finger-like uncharacterized protein